MTEHTPPAASSPSSWRKSSYSNSEGGSCLEIQNHHRLAVPVRDSKMPQGPALLLPHPSWSSFVEAVKAGTLTA